MEPDRHRGRRDVDLHLAVLLVREHGPEVGPRAHDLGAVAPSRQGLADRPPGGGDHGIDVTHQVVDVGAEAVPLVRVGQ